MPADVVFTLQNKGSYNVGATYGPHVHVVFTLQNKGSYNKVTDFKNYGRLCLPFKIRAVTTKHIHALLT